MLFAIVCTYKPDGDLLRWPYRQAHLKYMIVALPFTLFGGPFLLEDGQRSTGLVVVLDLPNRAAAVAFVQKEPYAKAGLFENIAIRGWKHMTADVLDHELKQERLRLRSEKLAQRTAGRRKTKR